MQVDLNSDMGESFGRYRLGDDEALMPWITSANIACGYHAGDPLVMRRTVALAVRYGVGIGAHPGFPDLVGFGRRQMQVTAEEVESDLLYQMGALAAFARAAGAKLAHVKAHGALYNMAETDPAVAKAILQAIERFDGNLIAVCPAGSAMAQMAAERGLHVAREGFADRAYNADGTLRSRRLDGAMIDDPQTAAAQAVRMAQDGAVVAFTGETIPLQVDTICLHGDAPGAVQAARAVRTALEAAGIAVRPMGWPL
ncbi:MAG: LamB/YcsF family protein [Chloroflexi bacterium]|nr:LamB/YcsF family protein [Chloroflexota bacterium]